MVRVTLSSSEDCKEEGKVSFDLQTPLGVKWRRQTGRRQEIAEHLCGISGKCSSNISFIFLAALKVVITTLIL